MNKRHPHFLNTAILTGFLFAFSALTACAPDSAASASPTELETSADAPSETAESEVPSQQEPTESEAPSQQETETAPTITGIVEDATMNTLTLQTDDGRILEFVLTDETDRSALSELLIGKQIQVTYTGTLDGDSTTGVTVTRLADAD